MVKVSSRSEEEVSRKEVRSEKAVGTPVRRSWRMRLNWERRARVRGFSVVSFPYTFISLTASSLSSRTARGELTLDVAQRFN